MMTSNNYIIFLHVVWLLPFMVMCSRYDYELFENFEITKASFIKEQNIVRKLQKIRQNLLQKRDAISFHLDGLSTFPAEENCVQFENRNSLENWTERKFKKLVNRISLQDKISSFVIDYGTENVIDYFNYNYNISGQSVIDGAQKGIIMLHETYDLDIKEFAKGHQ